jgi:quercetin dioxygenase-like cupin family protein
MAKFTALSRDELASSTAYAAPDRIATGVRSSVRVSPDDYSIWMVESALDDGAQLRWSGPHSDDGVYVIEGELDVEHDGTVRRCPTEGAIIVESDVECTARAIGSTRVLHVGAYDPAPPTDGINGPPAREGRTVHVVGDQGWYQSGNGKSYLAHWFADSTQEASRIALFHVALHEPHRRDIPHSHSQDELIYIMDGSLVMGRSEYMPGTCLALPANVRYSVTTGAHGIKFINFRRDASIQEYGKVKAPEPESAIARGGRLVGDLR